MAERHGMDCERVQELIAPFVNGKLNTEETEEFLRHIDTCSECKEELEVSYSLMTAMKQLDEGTDLSDNYIQELNDKIEACFMDGLKKKRDCARRRVILAALVFALLFLTGSMASEKRCAQEEALLRTVLYVEDDAGEESVEQNDKIETENNKNENGMEGEQVP